jgi:hypothetical protein
MLLLSQMATENTADLCLYGPDAEDHEIAASVLVRVLGGLQETAYVLGAASENRPIGQRLKPTAEHRARYQLRCGVPESGSYRMPLTIGSHAGQPPLTYDLETVPKQLFGLLHALQHDEPSRLRDIIPDSRVLNLALRKLETALPKPGETWELGFGLGHYGEAVVNSRDARVIERILQVAPEPDTVMTVTGELIRIDFQKYRVYLRYPPTNRELECVYVPDIEDTLIDKRRDYIQVTGQYTLDEDGNPKGLTDVTKIEAVDLSPMTFEYVPYGSGMLHLTPPLTVNLTLEEESKQTIGAIDESINLYAFAPTREDLADEIAEHLVFLWRSYALEEASKLSPKAKLLRVSLLARIQDSIHAAG